MRIVFWANEVKIFERCVVFHRKCSQGMSRMAKSKRYMVIMVTSAYFVRIWVKNILIKLLDRFQSFGYNKIIDFRRSHLQIDTLEQYSIKSWKEPLKINPQKGFCPILIISGVRNINVPVGLFFVIHRGK